MTSWQRRDGTREPSPRLGPPENYPAPRSARIAAVGLGLCCWFVVSVDLIRLIRPLPLIDPDPSWALPRFLLGLFVVVAAGGVASLAAGAFLLFSRSRAGRAEPAPLALSGRSLVFIALASIGVGAFLRCAFLSRLQIPYLEDEVNLISPSLALSGTWSDFADAIRPIPYGVADPHETIGVLYLRLLRGTLAAIGTTPLGLRLPSLGAGVLSLITGTLLGRALLPAGGGAITALVLSGMRWHFILSLSGWHSILVAPLADVAALLLLSARRRRTRAPALVAGAVVGLGCHVYLSAWIAAAALAVFSLWPVSDRRPPGGSPAWRTAAFAAGLLVAVAPIFLFAKGRVVPYFGRTARHSVLVEMRYAKSTGPLFAAAADALASPWFLAEPEGRHDLPGRSRLGPILGIAVAVALAGALQRPKREASALFLCHGGAALAAAVAGGQAGLPNGFRFGYLTTITAVAAAAGVLQLAGLAAPARARAAALLAVGLLAVSGALGVRDALLVWPDHRATFDSFHGEDTLLGGAAGRWESYGTVSVASKLGRSDLTIDTVARYGLGAPPSPPAAGRGTRAFRLEHPGTRPGAGERVVEDVRDAWGREWAVVLGRSGAP